MGEGRQKGRQARYLATVSFSCSLKCLHPMLTRAVPLLVFQWEEKGKMTLESLKCNSHRLMVVSEAAWGPSGNHSGGLTCSFSQSSGIFYNGGSVSCRRTVFRHPTPPPDAHTLGLSVASGLTRPRMCRDRAVGSASLWLTQQPVNSLFKMKHHAPGRRRVSSWQRSA